MESWLNKRFVGVSLGLWTVLVGATLAAISGYKRPLDVGAVRGVTAEKHNTAIANSPSNETHHAKEGSQAGVETKSRVVSYTVMKPVYEQHQREVRYTVMRPVHETREKTVNYTVFTTVPEARTKTVSYTVCTMVPEVRTKTVSYRTCRMVPESRQKVVNYSTDGSAQPVSDAVRTDAAFSGD